MAVAIVTGAARGIGAAIAVSLHQAGHQLVLIDRCSNDDRLDYDMASAAELEAVSAQCDHAPTIIGDVADLSTSAEAVSLAVAEHGGLDIAVAAAGVMGATVPAWEIDDRAWDAMWSTNATGTLQLARASIPAMLTRPQPRVGRFVALSTAIVDKATPRLAGYAASKGAVQSFVRSLAADLANTGITANIVQPGATPTALLDRSAAVYDLDDAAEFAEHHIDQRLVEPAEIGATVAWLCSAAASALNGAVIPVDAGMTAR